MRLALSARKNATSTFMQMNSFPRLLRSFSKKNTDEFIQENDPRRVKEEAKDQSSRNAEENPLLKDPQEEEDNSFYSTKKSTIFMLIGACGAMVGLYFLMIVNTAAKDKSSGRRGKVTHIGKANIGGSWELKDVNGKKFGSADLEGKYYLIYFGFCRCPDVCPQSLNKLTKALEIIRRSPEKKYFELEFVFVTVDPDRDDKEAIETFLKHFDKKIIGVTGDNNKDPALRQMMSKFKIHASKIELEEEQVDPSKPKPYTLDHTIITYLMDDENTYLTHIGSNMSASETAQHIITKVITSQKERLLK